MDRAEIVEIAAVRVRDDLIVDDFHRRVKPRVPIERAARRKHGLSEAHVEHAPFGVPTFASQIELAMTKNMPLVKMYTDLLQLMHGLRSFRDNCAHDLVVA